MNDSVAGSSADSLDSRISDYIETYAVAYGIPGLAVGVVVDGKPAVTHGFGVQGMGSGRPVGADTVFHAASVSKTFTATAVMQLVERGELSLDDRLAAVLPEFCMADERYRTITIRQLLCHTAGMPDVSDYHWDKPEHDDDALGRFVDSCSALQLVGEPGAEFSYSNVGYEILGHLVAVLSGLSFEAYIDKHILSPLGMTSSTFLSPRVPESVRAEPHLRSREVKLSPVFPYNRAHAPSSTLQTSARDLAVWAACNLGGGEFGGRRILSAGTHASMWVPFAETGRSRELVTSVGAAWFLGSRNGVRTVSHAGRDTGFCSIVILAPERRIASCVLCNLSPVPVEQLGLGILDIAMGHEPKTPRLPAIIECMAAYNEGGAAALGKAYGELSKKAGDAHDFSSGYLISLAEASLETSDTALALDVLRLGATVDPANAGIHEMLARVYFMRGDMESAGASAMRSLEIDPANRSLAARVSMLAKK